VPDPLHALTIGDVARENRRRYPGRTALVCGTTRLSFPDLDLRSSRLASALAGTGVGNGDRVLWLGQNCHRVVELLVACSKLGAVLCPANWRSSVSELAFVLDDAAPKVVFAQKAEIGPAAREVQAHVRNTGRWVGHDDDGPLGYEAFLASGAPDDAEVPMDDGEPVLMIYTGAFGGRPNGSLSSSISLINQGLIAALVERLDHDDVFLASGPLFHIGCWRYVMAMLLFGGTNVMVRRVDAEEICRLVVAERCTHAYLFKATQEQIVALNADRRYDLSSLRTIKGDPQWEAMVSLRSNPWLERPERYGQTEAGGIVAFGAFGPGPAGRHGRTNPLAQLRIVDDAGRETEEGETGEIVVRGPMTMTGYHNRPELNREKLGGGWVRTRDLGRREWDGSITFVGPKARMLKCGLENVYPAEVELAVRSHPDVADCAVIGVPDDRFIQVVKAVVVPADGASLTAEQVIGHARGLLAHYKAPKSVAFVPELPRVGDAVDYASLDDRFGGGNYPGGDTPTGR
jgi:long-chain acyl-CoA synthetase